MPTEQIARSLAFINWTVLTGLAAGSFLAAEAARRRTEATPGFVRFTALAAAVFAILAAISDTALPVPGPDAPIVASPALDGPRQGLLVALAVIAILYAALLRRPRAAAVLGILGVAAGFGAIVVGAVGWARTAPEAGPLLVQLVALALSTGGVFAAMILGHWYLVTPKLPTQPLVLFAKLLLVIVGVQLLLFVVWLATGAGMGLPPFQPLVGEWAFFVWMRLLVGLVFPLILSWAALQTAKTRSMESATGLLYIDVGAIAVGTILASGLYFGAGLLT
ncbi:MAG: hypothetical protein MUE82_03615 [Chloroflexi bacterium]|nr:hypothetical protein [Chloroflexota bacterium]